MMLLLRVLFGIIAILIGVLNIFWGNDPGYGIAVLLAAMLFFPRVTSFIHRSIGIRIPNWSLWLLALFIVWTALGVAELFNKIAIMRSDLFN